MTNRIEHDTLGEVGVPAHALYGAQTQRAVVNFPISGLKPRRAFIWPLGAIKLAAAQVNRELGLLDPAKADAIAQAAREVMEGRWDAEFVVDPFQAGAGTSHHMNGNEVIANRATQILGGALGEYRVHPNDDVNLGQSTNDVIPSAIRLGCLWRLDDLLGAVDGVSTELRRKAEAFDGIIKSGRTHLQDAVPVRLGQEFGAYGHAVARDRVRLVRAAEGLRRLGIGGTAAGTGLNAHPEFHGRMVQLLREVTGLDLSTSSDLFESMQSMADAVEFSAAMRVLALTLTRIANDLRLMASGPASGLDEIRFAPVQPGSSIMPGKVNPVMAEMLNQAMYSVIGHDLTVALAAQAGQFELNVMMPVIAYSLFEMMQLMTGAMTAFTERGVKGITANPASAAKWLEHNAIIATALNPLIGYAAAAELVKAAQASSRSVREIARERTARGELQHRVEARAVRPDEVDAALDDLRRMTEGGLQGAAPGQHG